MVWALVLLLAVIVTVTPSSVALAQAPPGQTAQAPPAAQTETRDDDSGKWGLVGLLGLLGLAGLMRRDRARPVDRTDRPGRS
jgi:MYXO-CTERM domain-containing protein